MACVSRSMANHCEIHDCYADVRYERIAILNALGATKLTLKLRKGRPLLHCRRDTSAFSSFVHPFLETLYRPKSVFLLTGLASWSDSSESCSVEYFPLSSLKKSRQLMEDFVDIWQETLSTRSLPGRFMHMETNFVEYSLSDHYSSQHTAVQYAVAMGQLIASVRN